MKSIDELIKIAEAATQGKWEWGTSREILNDRDYFYLDHLICNGEEICNFGGTQSVDGWGLSPLTNDQIHITTFDPPTVIELLYELRSLREILNATDYDKEN